MEKRLLGVEHPSTLTSASNLAMSLSKQGKYADAERMNREVHEAMMRMHGTEHPSTQLYLEEARRRAGGFSFTHVPSHCKILGNERADELAARGPTSSGRRACAHRESGVLQEAGFRKLGLAPCSRLPAFFRAKPQHPRLRIWKQEAGSRTHLKL